MKNYERCKAHVADTSGFHFNRCRNKAVTKAGYCRVHDPDERRKRAKRRGPTKWERDLEASERRRKRRAAIERGLSDSTGLLVLLLEKSPRLAASLRGRAERQIARNKEAIK